MHLIYVKYQGNTDMNTQTTAIFIPISLRKTAITPFFVTHGEYNEMNKMGHFK